MTKHPKRLRDPAQLAKLINDIATGEVEDRESTPEERGKGPGGCSYGPEGRIVGQFEISGAFNPSAN
jgi:hypothetical protein